MKKAKKTKKLENELLIDEGDVSIAKLMPPECDTCENPAKKVVMLDLRCMGMNIPVGKFCDQCIDNEAKHLRKGLRKGIKR